ncbi:MAG: DUF1610 domain-containing protein [Candidatus Aenigmarchaeota archaeon]|nr:DUF1610 domain-containing protein [Candidatus Aenigmarchaeota archaeon]
MKCTTCHENLMSEENFTKFACPQCLETTTVRCTKCRRKTNLYTCTKCDFEGP